MLDHIGLNVSDYERGRDFYQRAHVVDPDGNHIEAVCHHPE